MKLSTRLSLIVACAASGTVILVMVALQTIHSSMLSDRQEQIRSMINLAVKQVGVYVALEKDGTLSREEAQNSPLVGCVFLLALTSPFGLPCFLAESRQSARCHNISTSSCIERPCIAV